MSSTVSNSTPQSRIAAWDHFSDDAKITLSSNKESGLASFKPLGWLGHLWAKFSFKSTIQQNTKSTLDQVCKSIKDAYPELNSEHVDDHFKMIFHTSDGTEIGQLQQLLPTGKQLKALKAFLDHESYKKFQADVRTLLTNYVITPQNINSPGEPWDDSAIYNLKQKLGTLLKSYPPDSGLSYRSELKNQIESLTAKLNQVYNDMAEHPSRTDNMQLAEREQLSNQIKPLVEAIQTTLAGNTKAFVDT